MFFYILEDPDKVKSCKVGITKNPKQRLKSYKTASPSAYFKFLHPIDKDRARYHEKTILSILSDVFRVNSEVVYGPYSLVENIVSGYFEDLREKDSSS